MCGGECGLCSGSNTSDGGGGGASGSSVFSSSIPGSESLGSLSDGDKQKLCTELASFKGSESFQSAEINVSCGAAGIFSAAMATDQTDAGLQVACKSAHDQCATMISSAAADASKCMPPDATCSATVSELSACLNEMVAAFDALQVPGCDTLTAASLKDSSTAAQGASQAKGPGSCTTFQAKCPGSSMP